MNANIIIIGAGQLGSRHLQSLHNLPTNIKIYVVDPYQASLDLSKTRWEEMSAPHSITFQQNIPENLNIDCAILSSTANVRADNTRELLSKNSVKFIIFEKVLFQKLSDYDEIEVLLKEKNVQSWVNCPRRMWPIYQRFYEQIGAPSPVHLHVSGYPWGMGCNSIHMLDLTAYMAGTDDYMINYTDIDEEIINSKRKGFLEFTGRFGGTFNDGSTFHIEAINNNDVPYMLTLKSSKGSIIVHEDFDYYDLYKNGAWSREKLEIPRQSQLTSPLIQEILATGASPLTPFSESKSLHLPLVEMLAKHVHSINEGDKNICPIT